MEGLPHILLTWANDLAGDNAMRHGHARQPFRNEIRPWPLLAHRIKHTGRRFCRDSEREAALAGALRKVGTIKARAWGKGGHGLVGIRPAT